MFRVALILSLASLCCCYSTPLFEGKNFKVYKLEDDYTRAKGQEIQETTRSGFRSIVEVPYNGSIPQDDGSALYGDLEFETTNKDGELLIRDTIVNENYGENVLIQYTRNFPGYYVEDVRVYNVGRQRGFTTFAGIVHTIGFVQAEILVPANNVVRIFVEVYVRA